MSNAVSALNGKVATANGVTVRDCGLQGMISMRGTFEDENFFTVLSHIIGLEIPDVRTIVSNGDRSVAWMSPDELLVLVPYADVNGIVAQIEEALQGSHFLAVNVSDARSLIAVEGEGAAEVIAKNVPVDLSAGAFGEGMVRRTRMAQVAAAVWCDGTNSYKVICFRSVSTYVFDLLAQSAKDGLVGAF